MAYLWQRNDSGYWWACYYGPDGRRVRVSTKQADKAAALQWAVEMENAARRARAGTLTEAHARRIIGELVEAATGEPLVHYTAEGWLREWLSGKTGARAKGTALKYGRTVQSFLAHLGPRAKLNLNQVRPADVKAWRDAEAAAGKHANTVNGAVKHLRVAFGAAVRAGFLEHNPAAAVEGLAVRPGRDVPHDDDGHEGARDVFTPEQIAALLRVASPDWRSAILLGYYSGARLGDVVNLTWAAADLAARTLRFRARKTGQHVLVPLHPSLAAHLESLPSTDDARAPIMPSLAGRSSAGKSGLSQQFARLMTAAGVAGRVRQAGGAGGRRLSSLSFHSLRHSFNSALAAGGVAQEVRMKLTGHADAEQNTHYTHHELSSLRAAVDGLPALEVGQ